jgi:hypothetical protein
MKIIKLAALILAIALLSACSRTVQWEEEVPLNTGETIWVQRSMPWVFKGGMGNPFNMAMRPTGEQTIRFTYGGKEYSFTGKVLINWIAVSPDRQPVLVAIPGSYGWNFQFGNNYYCVTPYYVQFVPEKSGTKWTWPEAIEPWLYKLPANVMVNIPSLDEKRQVRYSNQDRNQRDSRYRLQSSYGSLIDSKYDAQGDCPKKYDPSIKPTQTRSEK